MGSIYEETTEGSEPSIFTATVNQRRFSYFHFLQRNYFFEFILIRVTRSTTSHNINAMMFANVMLLVCHRLVLHILDCYLLIIPFGTDFVLLRLFAKLSTLLWMSSRTHYILKSSLQISSKPFRSKYNSFGNWRDLLRIHCTTRQEFLEPPLHSSIPG